MTDEWAQRRPRAPATRLKRTSSARRVWPSCPEVLLQRYRGGQDERRGEAGRQPRQQRAPMPPKRIRKGWEVNERPWLAGTTSSCQHVLRSDAAFARRPIESRQASAAGATAASGSPGTTRWPGAGPRLLRVKRCGRRSGKRAGGNTQGPFRSEL